MLLEIYTQIHPQAHTDIHETESQNVVQTFHAHENNPLTRNMYTYIHRHPFTTHSPQGHPIIINILLFFFYDTDKQTTNKQKHTKYLFTKKEAETLAGAPACLPPIPNPQPTNQLAVSVDSTGE